MARPRIRTLKPECWQDEAVGHLSHTERLLWVGLITMADDEGRLRAPAAAIIGHVFPWDEETMTTRKLYAALDAIQAVGLIVRYEHEGRPYVAVCGWNHQRIDKAQTSTLPAPPAGSLVELSPNDPRQVAA